LRGEERTGGRWRGVKGRKIEGMVDIGWEVLNGNSEGKVREAEGGV